MFNSIAVAYVNGDNADSEIETRSNDVVSATLEPETEWILNNLMVVDPTALLNATFGETAVEAVEASANLIGNAFEGQKTNWGLESEMYAPLTQAFNKWIAGVVPICKEDDYSPTDSLECLNISTSSYSRSPEMGFTTKTGPDLCLTFDSKHIQAQEAKPCDTPNVLIEVKLDINTDILIGSRGSGSETSKECKKLVQQLFGYVAYDQWPSLPYRFSWTISVSNNTLRIWRWSSSGTIVTEPIYYLKNPTPIIQFVQLLAAGPYSRLGLDIGVGVTFYSVAAPEIANKLKGPIEKYSKACGQSISLTRWVEKANKAKILVFNQIQAGSIEGPPTKCGPILVVSHPISSTVGIFCRATRCYLAIHESDANSDEGIDCKDIHVLKVSWQNTTSISESAIFQMAKNRSSNGTVPHLATVLSAGDVISTEQKLGLFQARSPGSAMPNDEELAKNYKPLALDQSADEPQVVSSHPRILRWILFKEAGIRLNSFRNVREMLQAFLDAVSAHRSLCDIGILHQDISEGNVLMDPSNACSGMLIDLDMAEDLQAVLPEGEEPPTRPPMTGTLRFISLALQNRPIHRSWHDLESFFWLLVYITLKHVPDATLVENDTKEFGRTEGLKSVFPDGAHTSEIINDAKRKFLNQGHVRHVGNDALEYLLNEFCETFRELHLGLQRAHTCWQNWSSLAKFVELPNHSRLVRMPYSVESLADLRRYLDDSNATLEELTKRQYAPDIVTTVKKNLTFLGTSIKAMKKHINEDTSFPDHEYILAKLTDALLNDSQLDPNSPSFDYEALLKARITY